VSKETFVTLFKGTKGQASLEDVITRRNIWAQCRVDMVT